MRSLSAYCCSPASRSGRGWCRRARQPARSGAIVERPLFTPSRRPAPGVSAISPTIESRYRLVGIMGNGAKRKAFVAEGPRRTEITAGDRLDGWTVKEIGQDRVVLTSPAGEAVLKLTRIVVPEAPKPQ
jgi:hypothetical protein